MHSLVEIVHPADVLFFLRPIRMMEERGHRVTVVSREKDVAGALLDRFGIAHTPISRQGRGLAGLGIELVRRDFALYRHVRRDRPDVMLGFGGVAISHVGWATGIPSLVIYDTDKAGLQIRIAWPFLSALIVPEDWQGAVARGRTERLAGTKDLSYFHPSAFRPDPDRARAQGLAPDRPNVFVRMVRWSANHDIGKRGWSEEEASALVAALGEAKLHVSAEAEPPSPLHPHLWRGDPTAVHHLLGCCDAYVGESATMACEAATMGVPALYAGEDLWGYVAGLGRRGLVEWCPPAARAELGPRAAALLADRSDFDAAHQCWLAKAPDWSEVVVQRAERLAARSRRA
ncbi:MAG: DUF354 domain-containing protein [Pseudomonadota bacterium]